MDGAADSQIFEYDRHFRIETMGTVRTDDRNSNRISKLRGALCLYRQLIDFSCLHRLYSIFDYCSSRPLYGQHQLSPWLIELHFDGISMLWVTGCQAIYNICALQTAIDIRK